MEVRQDDDDDYDESELGRRVIHNHYSQSKNGNGNGAYVNKVLLTISGALLATLLAIQAFMWRDQLAFQREVIDRLARVETQLAQPP
jgi:hypothetical protein